MPRYRIRFNIRALDDIETSISWGLENWGEELTIRWSRELYGIVYGQLSVFPLSCPVAPESAETGLEIRQLIFDRYRILFTVMDDEVLILYVRGPFHF